MLHLSHLHDIVRTYYALHSDERNRGAVLRDCLENSGLSILQRTNVFGHITTSAFVLFQAGPASKVLLIHHRSLGRMLQPGGHYENDESLISSALRELQEETGLHYNLTDQPSERDALLDIDTHRIPANSKRNEAEHYHFDFAFLIRVDSMPDVRLQDSEVTDYAWMPVTAEDLHYHIGPERAQKLNAAVAGDPIASSGHHTQQTHV